MLFQNITRHVNLYCNISYCKNSKEKLLQFGNRSCPSILLFFFEGVRPYCLLHRYINI